MQIKENKSVFLEYFGDTPKLRVMDFLIDNHMFDFPVTEIARESNVSYNSIKMFFDKFVGAGIVVRTRRVGKSEFYRLNMDNDFVNGLVKLDWVLTKGVKGAMVGAKVKA